MSAETPGEDSAGFDRRLFGAFASPAAVFFREVRFFAAGFGARPSAVAFSVSVISDFFFCGMCA
jgi:hypothetical protein